MKGLVYQLENCDAVEGTLSEGTCLSSGAVQEAREIREAETEYHESRGLKIKRNESQEESERSGARRIDKLKKQHGKAQNKWRKCFCRHRHRDAAGTGPASNLIRGENGCWHHNGCLVVLSAL